MALHSKIGAMNETVLPQKVVELIGATPPDGSLVYELGEDGRMLLSAKSESFADLAGTFPKATPAAGPVSAEAMGRSAAEGAEKRFRRHRA